MVWSGRRMCSEVMQAPKALILRVLVSSMNSAPEASVPRMNTGTCKRMRGERLVDCASTPILSLSLASLPITGALEVGTKDLVRNVASWMPEASCQALAKLFRISSLLSLRIRSSLLNCEECSGNPLPFLNCANGTLLPLTVRSPSASMINLPGKIFTTTSKGRD